MNRDPLENLKAELDKEIFQKREFKSRKSAILKEAREQMSNSQQKKSPRWAPIIASLAIPLIGVLLIGPMLMEKQQPSQHLDSPSQEVPKQEKLEETQQKVKETPEASEIKKTYSSMWEQAKLNFTAMYFLADYQVNGKEYVLNTEVEYKNGNLSIHQQNVQDESLVLLEDHILYNRGNDLPLYIEAIPAPAAYLKAEHDSGIMSYPYYPSRLPEDIASNDYTWEIIEETDHGIKINGFAKNEELSIKNFTAKIHPETGILLSFEGENQDGERMIEWQDRKFYYEDNPLGVSENNQNFIQNELNVYENLTLFLNELLPQVNDELKQAMGSIMINGSPEKGIWVDLKLNRKLQKSEEEQAAEKIIEALIKSWEGDLSKVYLFEVNFYNPGEESEYIQAYTEPGLPLDGNSTPEIHWKSK